MHTRETGESVIVLRPNYDIFANHNSSQAKKLPTPPPKSNQLKTDPSSFGKVTPDNTEKKIYAQAKTTQNTQIPFTPYTGVNSNSKATSVPFNGESQRVNPFSTNTRNSAVSTTPVSTVNNPLAFQNRALSPSINNSHIIHSGNSHIPSSNLVPSIPNSINQNTQINLASVLQEHQIKKNKSIENLKNDLEKVKGARKALPKEWNKTFLDKTTLERAEQMYTKTETSIKNFREESKKSKETNLDSINQHVYRYDLLIDEVAYIYAYNYYIDCLKFGQKNVPIPVPPKVTLSSLTNTTSKVSTPPSSTKISNVVNTNELNKIQKEGWKFAYNEEDGIYTSVSPGCGFVGGEKIVIGKGESRIIRIRTIEEDKDFHEFLANAYK